MNAQESIKNYINCKQKGCVPAYTGMIGKNMTHSFQLAEALNFPLMAIGYKPRICDVCLGIFMQHPSLNH